ncbi:hypothetical protein [Streptomyces sp. NBC_00986]|uniref:hypothetical protein n=1 Tax=Streptomyces sp. NBC_00986 TaxID=2903702 RepID=UPI00386B35DA|nr:hypothetical protein OG504_13010 [Streptomyces sp. NBC_00986]
MPGRLFKSATSETRSTDDGYMTDELLEFCEPMVRAGIPLIVTGDLYVSPRSKSAGRQVGIDDDKKAGLRDWVDLARAGGSLGTSSLPALVLRAAGRGATADSDWPLLPGR